MIVSDKTRVRSFGGGPLWNGANVKLSVLKEGGIKCSIALKNHCKESNLLDL